MKRSLLPLLAAALFLCVILWAGPAQAAPRQYVIVLSEGLSPQVLDMGRAFARKADEDPESVTAFDNVLKEGQVVAPCQLEDLKGLLETAEATGYKTGLVTNDDLSHVVPLFYGMPGTAEAITSPDASFEFLAGGGAGGFTPAQLQAFTAAGNTLVLNQEDRDAEMKGRVLAVQGDVQMPFALDRKPHQEVGLAELATLAINTLGEKNEPFVLVIHDALVKKAVETGDTPALFEQFRELNSAVSDVVARRQENPELALALLSTGGITPRFSTDDPEQMSNSFRAISNLRLSYAGAAEALQGADEAKLKEFSDPQDGIYPGLKPDAALRDVILQGTVSAEHIRDFYNPLLKLAFDGPIAKPNAVVMGFEAPQGLAAGLKSAVSKLPTG